ncbi:hypothetical protein COV58_00730 [Candidatus Roizmanbacteria bacterium CG11_big_fil_rev_8_21_14_0_20_36_8]|uniref:Uncharacterized protein n=2 Tax=Candidatus Roizmaniibacteriota TaxID=1752723 RepID=A0A2M6IV11_9BACT|nr:MAG: hypothetical protein COV58_00730 [Candidatus Roizmanbacteria bacterium CG11_big_fil_rev_8_21_14_0_20_36_8]PIZ64472.1 MAG: hypothetical protein COY14_04660 [Candidatus Roizmanbacteria bacterium CG_4_10_14_0_2_um_filter_36_9]
MKKIHVFLGAGLLLIIVGGAFYFNKNINTLNKGGEIIESMESGVLLPERPAEINGVVKSIEGNEVIIANEIRDVLLTDKERDQQKAERQAMTQEERQALRLEEIANIETENVTFTIPVGVLIVKGSGESDGSSISAEMTEIQSGTYISVWMMDGNVEAVKLKGTN